MICRRPLWSAAGLHYPDAGCLVREKRSLPDENVCVGLEAVYLCRTQAGEGVVSKSPRGHKSHYIGYVFIIKGPEVCGVRLRLR